MPARRKFWSIIWEKPISPELIGSARNKKGLGNFLLSPFLLRESPQAPSELLT